MRNLIRKASLSVALATTVLASSYMYGSNAVAAPTTLNATASIKLLVPLNITENGTGMNFGVYSVPSSNAEVTLSTTGVLSETNTTQIDVSAKANGNFTVTGDSTNAVTVTVSNNGGTLVLKDFVFKYDGSADKNGTASALPAPGAGKVIVVGATVEVPASTAGVQTGSYTVAVNYD